MLDSLAFLPEVTLTLILYGNESICHESNISIFSAVRKSSNKVRDSKFYQFNKEQKLAEGALSSYRVCYRSYFECLRGGWGCCASESFFLCLLLVCLFIYFLVLDLILLKLFFFFY